MTLFLKYLAFLSALVVVLVATASPGFADNAPMQPTTAGLVPGMPGTTVRMRAEKVDIHVVEHDHSTHAIVTATFDMVNSGPTVNLLTGFPKFAGSYFAPGGFAGFDPTQFADFHASSGSTVFQPTIQPVKLSADSIFNGDWYVWQMDYPSNATTTVQVGYDQTLAEETNGYAYASYILRTGALWNGTIGDAVVTMTADSGGAFLLPSVDEARQSVNTQLQPVPQSLPNNGLPTESKPDQVTWHLTDFEPSFDPFVFYVPADAWQRFTNAQALINANNASASDYAAAVEAYFDSIGRVSGGVPWVVRHAVPQPLRDRSGDVLAWANQATSLAPDDPSTWEALGDAEYLHEIHPTLYIDCRPQQAPAAYQHAIDLGSSTAQAKLEGIQQIVRTGVEVHNGLPPCNADGASAAPDVTPQVLTDDVRSEILDAIDRANQVWKDTNFNLDTRELTMSGWVAGDLLQADLAEVDQLRKAGQRRGNTNVAFDVLDVNLDSPGHAVVRTRETWSAVITAIGNGAVVREIPPATYMETYIVEYQHGSWVVTRNDV